MAASNVFSAKEIADIIMEQPSTDESAEESSDTTTIEDELSDSNFGNPMVSSDSNSSSDGEMKTTPCAPTRGRARVRGGVKGGRGQHSITPTRGGVRTRGAKCGSVVRTRALAGGDPRPLLEALANGGFDADIESNDIDHVLEQEGDSQQPFHTHEPQTINVRNAEPAKRQHIWSDVASGPPIFQFDEQSGLLVETHDDIIPPSEKKQRPTKPCRICSQNKQRHESRYFCPVCREKPALCVDKCFRQYHNEKN
ncbi:hypothetical protein LOTGIDRAFT_155021 [Lottia gigantea]|uniref:PiggyBac transposable element-derived protein 4 C-terminal zinc-finger domain-containing protein n=1 Tax=Lottia gigantea TaxID=225164 RepID=V3ZX53_LOTGI|nr:hypothetical protein LOTGIDRAFT_155021 [Lottia gigantea]ESO85536.1 hypothetical protein LOTGIDRAFT_155021 [Lottia gigantea]